MLEDDSRGRGGRGRGDRGRRGRGAGPGPREPYATGGARNESPQTKAAQFISLEKALTLDAAQRYDNAAFQVLEIVL